MGETGAPIRLVLFDFDGTLVDSQHAIVEAMGMAFAGAGLRRPSPAAVRRVVGLSLERAMATLIEEDGDIDFAMDQIVQIADRYRRAHAAIRARPDHPEPLFPGVRETLSGLNHPERFLGIATGKSMAGLADSLDRHGLSHLFATLQTGDRNRGKPDPEMAERAMEAVGVEPSDTVMVGDTVYDMAMAGNAGIAPVGVSWGYHPPEELKAAGAVQILETPGELLFWISSREKRES